MRLWYLPLLCVIIIVMHGIKCEFLYQFWTFLHHFCTPDFCSPACFCERFEPRSHFLSRLSMILWVNVVLNRTVVVVDSDWRFDNLSSSHLQSQSELYQASWWYWHNSLWLWRWLYRIPHRLSKQQQSYSGLCSPGQSYSTYLPHVSIVNMIQCLQALKSQNHIEKTMYDPWSHCESMHIQ